MLYLEDWGMVRMEGMVHEVITLLLWGQQLSCLVMQEHLRLCLAGRNCPTEAEARIICEADTGNVSLQYSQVMAAAKHQVRGPSTVC